MIKLEEIWKATRNVEILLRNNEYTEAMDIASDAQTKYVFHWKIWNPSNLQLYNTGFSAIYHPMVSITYENPHE